MANHSAALISSPTQTASSVGRPNMVPRCGLVGYRFSHRRRRMSEYRSKVPCKKVEVAMTIDISHVAAAALRDKQGKGRNP